MNVQVSYLEEYRIIPSLYTLSDVGRVCSIGFLRLTAWSTNMSGIHIWDVMLGWRVMYSFSELSGIAPGWREILSSYQNIRNVVSTETVSATSLTSSTLRRFIEKLTLTHICIYLLKTKFDHTWQELLLVVVNESCSLESLLWFPQTSCLGNS